VGVNPLITTADCLGLRTLAELIQVRSSPWVGNQQKDDKTQMFAVLIPCRGVFTPFFLITPFLWLGFSMSQQPDRRTKGFSYAGCSQHPCDRPPFCWDCRWLHPRHTWNADGML